MSDLFNFWTHGVNVVPEFTREYTNDDNGLFMKRAGWGSLIRQRRGTSNWFHFSIPSSTSLDDDSVRLRDAWLYGEINGGAILRRVDVRHLRVSFDDMESQLLYSEDVNITDRAIRGVFRIGNARCRGAIAICARVEFLEDSGEVLFRGAGCDFVER